ncbi:phosphatase 2C-like domain-containing protein [Schizophyllum fasciatum]
MTDIQLVYDAMSIRGVATVADMGLEIHHSSLRGLKAVSEDRIVIEKCESGVLIAVLDGHYTDELSDYAAKVLPRQLCDRISRTSCDAADFSASVERAFIEGIEEFDASLLDDVLKHFPQGPDTDWDDPLWDDRGEVYEIIGYGKEDPIFCAVRRTIVGSTVIVAFVDKAKRNVWVASLGDSEAGALLVVFLLGRIVDDRLHCVPVSDLRGVHNPSEVARLQAEHPNEPPVIFDERNLGRLPLTRALGDFPMKVSLSLTTRILSSAYPSYLGTNHIEDWTTRGHLNPPYISSTPTVQRHALLPGDVLVMASDGLRLALEDLGAEDAKTQAMIAFALSGAFGPSAAAAKSYAERLGHTLEEPPAGDNVADRVIRNALFGADEAKMRDAFAPTHADPNYYRDDISVVVVRLS